MSSPQFSVLAIPLNRPEVVRFLQDHTPQSQGKSFRLIGLRPTETAQAHWARQLQQTPTLKQFLTIDDPLTHLISLTSDRLVPVEFLKEKGFLTRNLGGWTPIYFAVAALPQDYQQDPVLKQAVKLAAYGPTIRYFGSKPEFVQRRLPTEIELTPEELCRTAVSLHHQRLNHFQTDNKVHARIRFIETLYTEIGSGSQFGAASDLPIPRILLLDEMISQLVHLELSRRRAAAAGDRQQVEQIGAWQQRQQAETGLVFILKGEYIVGRHRSSMVLILPELGVVVKQPAPEPFHEIELGARTVNGRPENWPRLIQDGALVTPRGRVRLILEEDLLPRLLHVCGHHTRFSALMGLIVEPYVAGKTAQEIVQADPARLTPALYDEFVLRQQVCELLGIENGDWHAANFIERAGDGRFVHVDWGAARPLLPDEQTPQGRQARLNQVQNIGFSFHNDALADKVSQIHQELLNDPARLHRLRQRAQDLVTAAGLSSA